MKSKDQKKKELAGLKEKIPTSQITVFTAFSKPGEKGLSVSQLTQLKRILKAANSEYVVIKKTLMELALRNSGFKDADVFQMEGSLGLVIGRGDPYEISKKLYEFTKKNPALHFFGAIFEKGFIGLEKFLEIAKMPNRETLIARLLGMMKYPISGLCITMSEIAKKKNLQN